MQKERQDKNVKYLIRFVGCIIEIQHHSLRSFHLQKEDMERKCLTQLSEDNQTMTESGSKIWSREQNYQKEIEEPKASRARNTIIITRNEDANTGKLKNKQLFRFQGGVDQNSSLLV